ncbi:MAG: aminopeptidase [Chloroflexota bacterium]|nr:aminopeptidase [Chloroflexota bacterium]
MSPSRIAQIADVLVNYSTRIQPGEQVAIVGPVSASPLLIELYRYALWAGAFPQLVSRFPEATEILLREGNDDQLQFISPIIEYVATEADCMIAVMSEDNTKALTSVDPTRQVLRAQSMRPVSKRQLERMGDTKDPFRWCGTLFPTNAHAQDAEMSLSEYSDFVFDACLPGFDQLPQDARAFAAPGADRDDPVTYWQTFSRWQGQMASYLTQRQDLHVVGPNIDLRLAIGGRVWLNADGHANFPDGEVFTGPVEDSVEGWVAFTYPAVYRGNEVQDVRLRFEKGRVVEASATRGEDFLIKILDTDEGARRLGEFAIGTNPGITRFTRNTLFDEKIKGTCHMAVGASIPGTGGENQSAIHWDMVCDLRKDSSIFADGELLYADGEFVVDFAQRGVVATSGVGERSMGRLFGGE